MLVELVSEVVGVVDWVVGVVMARLAAGALAGNLIPKLTLKLRK